jgi:2-iminoacetate synthase ThiH
MTRRSAGIVEFSNVCTKDCYYCGIRKHIQVKRYPAPTSANAVVSLFNGN